MNIIKLDNICKCENIDIKYSKNKYVINILKKDEYTLNLLKNNNIELNIYEDCNIILYGDVNILNLEINIFNSKILNIYKLTNNDNSKENIIVNLDSEFSKIKMNASYVGKINGITSINHNYSNTNSNINYRILGYNNDVKMDIIETVENKIKNCILNESCRVLKIDDSNVLIRPILKTRDYTVSANHSTVISNINDNDLLYLMSRGINIKEAKKLLIKGFIYCNLNIDDEIKKLIKI